MNVEGDAFWSALRRTSTEAQAARLQGEMQEVEAVLREIETECHAAGDTGASQPLSQAQIDQWVKHAIATEASTLADAEARSDLRVIPAHDGRRAKPWPAWIAAAAAFLLTPQFLVAATVVAGIAVTGALLQRTTTTLPFEHAINLLLDSEQPEAVREAAGGRVFFDVVESIQLLHELAESDAAIATDASDAIEQLLRELRAPTAFESRHFVELLDGLADQLLAAGPEFAARKHSLGTFVMQVRYGLQTLQFIEDRHESNAVGANNILHLQRIESLLSK